MNTSMKILTVVVTMMIQPGSQLIPASAALARISDSAMAPEAMAPPSDLTARPIQPPGDHGFSSQEVLRDEGEDQHFDAGEYHDERGNHDRNDGPGADGRAVAMAAETPQMEMPDASGAAHSRLNLKYRRAT